MQGWLTSPWLWLVLGIALMALEALVPGVFMIWFGIAAVLTALIDWAFGLSWQGNTIVFAGLALVSAFVGWTLTRRRNEEAGELPTLNRRAEALIGRVLSLDHPIVAHEGRVRIDDIVWRVSGPDLPAGSTVRVKGVAGTTLVIEHAPETAV